jgi:peptide/nickel transport system permease protein
LIAFPLGNLIGRVGAWKRSGFFLGSTTLVAVLSFTFFPPALAFALRRGLLNATTPDSFLTLTRLRDGEWRQAGLFGVIPAGDGTIPEPTDVLWQMVLIALAAAALVMLGAYLLQRVRRIRVPALLRAAAVIGLTAAGWVLFGIGWRSLDLLGVMLLPIIGVVTLYYGEIQLVTDAAMEEAIDADFVTTARAKGLPERDIRAHHAARAAILPVLSRLVVSIPYFLAGLAILEEVFGVPGGLGNLLFRAIRNQDTAVVVGTLVVVGVFSLVARLVMDLLYAVYNPRIRYGSGKLEVEVG